MFGIHRIDGDGLKIQSRGGWFYFSTKTYIYWFHIELGGFSISMERKKKGVRR